MQSVINHFRLTAGGRLSKAADKPETGSTSGKSKSSLTTAFMKYSLIFCGLMLTIQGQTFAQSNESLTYSSQRQQYKQQSKTGTIMGVVLLSTGLTLGYIGINQNLSNISILSNSRSGEGSAAFFMGLTLALSSVPVFIVAANNKRKSTLYLKQEKVQLPLPNTIINNAALVWRIPL